MTISATITAKQYTGNGVTTQFAFPNKIFAAADLVVTIFDNLGNQYPFTNFVQATLGLTYTVQGVDVDTGAIVVLSGPLTNLWTIDIRSLTPDLQSTSIKNQGSFLPELHEEAFDRLTRMIQDLLRLTYTYGIHGSDIELVPWPPLPGPSVRKGMASMFDAITGLPTIGVPNTQTITTGLLAPFLNLGVTAAESAALVTIVNAAWPPMYPERYGTNATPGTTDMTTAVQAAFKVAKVAGGVVNLGSSGTYFVTSPIDCTFTGGGNQQPILVRGIGGTNQPYAVVAQHNGVAIFDCTGNSTITFEDLTIGTAIPTANPFPKTGILLARNAAAGSLLNQLVRVKIIGYFSVAPYYNFGSENSVTHGCYFANYNPAAGIATRYYTVNNIAALTSPFTTIAAAPQSCIVHDDIACSDLINAGTATSDCIRLEGAANYNRHGGWMACRGGRSYIYVDQTTTTSSSCSIDKLTTEVSAPLPTYGILFGAAGSARIPTGWSVFSSRILTNAAGGFMFACADANTSIDGLWLARIGELTSQGVSIPGTLQGYSYLLTGPMVLAIGLVKDSTLIGLKSAWTIGGITGNTWLCDQAAGGSGFGTPTGAAIINNFPGATATLLQTSQTVAEILAVMKAKGMILV